MKTYKSNEKSGWFNHKDPPLWGPLSQKISNGPLSKDPSLSKNTICVWTYTVTLPFFTTDNILSFGFWGVGVGFDGITEYRKVFYNLHRVYISLGFLPDVVEPVSDGLKPSSYRQITNPKN